MLRTIRAWFTDWSNSVEIELHSPSIQLVMPTGWQETAWRVAGQKLAVGDVVNGTVFLTMSDVQRG
jgi:hypothetical protein